jgi:hypothetical protein
VRLTEYDILEQVDILEAEKRNLFIEFGKAALTIMSTAKDSDTALALVNHLRKIFFVDDKQKEREQIKDQADELIRLSQLTYRIAPGRGRGILEVTKE